MLLRVTEMPFIHTVIEFLCVSEVYYNIVYINWYIISHHIWLTCTKTRIASKKHHIRYRDKNVNKDGLNCIWGETCMALKYVADVQHMVLHSKFLVSLSDNVSNMGIMYILEELWCLCILPKTEFVSLDRVRAQGCSHAEDPPQDTSADFALLLYLL